VGLLKRELYTKFARLLTMQSRGREV
jgi:hypothetical protein